MEILSRPNVLSRHKGPAFQATYQDAIANADGKRSPLTTANIMMS
jgi:hypothetical protein